jgi:hypothetical protein
VGYGLLSLGNADASSALIHVAYLAALAAVSLAVGSRNYRRRLYV